MRYLNVYKDRHGHPRVYFRRGTYSVPLPHEMEGDEFMEAYLNALKNSRDKAAPKAETASGVVAPGKFVRHAERLVKFARSRSYAKGIACEITPRWVVRQIEAQGCRCSISGLPLRPPKPGAPPKSEPMAPSLDRINPAIGYTEANVRVVCYAVNVALNAWGEDVFIRVARGVLRTRREKIKMAVRGT